MTNMDGLRGQPRSLRGTYRSCCDSTSVAIHGRHWFGFQIFDGHLPTRNSKRHFFLTNFLAFFDRRKFYLWRRKLRNEEELGRGRTYFGVYTVVSIVRVVVSFRTKNGVDAKTFSPSSWVFFTSQFPESHQILVYRNACELHEVLPTFETLWFLLFFSCWRGRREPFRDFLNFPVLFLVELWHTCEINFAKAVLEIFSFFKWFCVWTSTFHGQILSASTSGGDWKNVLFLLPKWPREYGKECVFSYHHA